MTFSPKLKSFLVLITILTFISTLQSCGIYKPVDARKVSPNADDRVKKNIEEGKGFRLMGGKKGGTFDFASSNYLWRATLDTIDFMPLSSVNYSGGIIITDWYAENASSNESIKISIRFLTNEIRSDALDIKVFSRKCIDVFQNCTIEEIDGSIIPELKKKILKTAALYKQKSEEEANQ